MKKVRRARQQIQEQKTDEQITNRYNRIFFFLFIVYQILMIIFNGAFVRPQSYVSANGLDNSLFIATGTYLLVLIGFGLFFSYLKSYSWSGLGFTFLINVLVFQFYFLMNGFWLRSRLNQNQSSFTDTNINIYLSDQSFISSAADTQDATAVGAAKCGLALSIVLAAIGGRGGYLQVFIIAVGGTAMYELNSQLVKRFAMDIGGSMTVFLFGGTAGTVLALLLSMKQTQFFRAHVQYTATKMSRTYSIIGAVFCYVFFPVLNMDISPQLFLQSNAGISTFICISAAVISMLGICLIVDQRIDLRSLVTAPIAGGVIIGSSSAMIYNPLEALIMGTIAGVLQFVFNRLELKFIGIKPYWSNGVLFLFAVQGFIGGLFSSVFRAINKTSGSFGSLYTSLTDRLNKDQVGQIEGTFISLGLGALAGLLFFILIRPIIKDTRRTMYNDSGHWIVDDNFIQDKWEDQSEKVLELCSGSEEPVKGNTYL